MGKINQLYVQNLTTSCICELFNYGNMTDSLSMFTYDFKSGNVYGVIDEFGSGGWALSYVLAGKQKSFEGEIKINNNSVNYEKLKEFSCYVGDDSGKKKLFGISKMTVQEQIQAGIDSGKSFSNDINRIKEIFGLSNERFNRTIEYVSGERWKASMAIGYSLGKSIYCFPWLNTKYLMHLKEHLKLCIKPLVEIGAIIIIPTCNKNSINDIANITLSINDDSSSDSSE